MIRPGIRRLFRLALTRGRVPADVDEELRLHQQLRVEQLVAEGMAPDDARREAARRFGHPDARRELHAAAARTNRRLRGRDRLDALAHDVRYAVRVLARERGLTLLTALMLALGIGANAAMFGVVDRLLLRGPVGVREPDRVVRLYMAAEVPGIGHMTVGTFGYASYVALRDGARTLERVAAWSSSEGTLGAGERARTIEVGASTWEFFDLLGVRPVLGRTYTRAEDSPPSGERVVVLDHGLWQRDFGADSAVLGRPVLVGGVEHVVIGVLPPGFTGAELSRVDLWIPMSARSAGIMPDWPTTWNAQWLRVVARLAPGATLDAATAEATMLRRRAYGGDDEVEREASFVMLPLGHDESGREPAEVRIARWLLGVAALVLLIVCANVANLLLARAVGRRREIAVRLALGISRGRLVRLLLLESTLRALLGGAAALGVAWLVGASIRRTLLPDVAWPDSPVDARVFVFTMGAALLTGTIVGLTPALQARTAPLGETLNGAARAGGGRRARLRTALTVTQAALSVVLLVGAGLFVRSLMRVNAIPLGMQPERVLAVEVSWPRLPAADDSTRAALRLARERRLDATMEQLAAAAGVEAAAITVGTPFRSRFSMPLRVPGWDSLPRLAGGPYLAAVSPGYFATMGTRTVRGRLFGRGDRAGSEPVAIVNETMARTLWRGRSPLGACLHVGLEDDPTSALCRRVVGVVEDVRRSSLREDPAMQYYLPLGQESGIGGRQLLVRPRGPAPAFRATLRSRVAAALPEALFVDVQPFTSYLAPLMRPWRLGAALFGLFGLLALAVASLGLYSVMAYMVAQRTHELGVRRALGAGAPHLRRLILRRGVATAAAGCAIGVALALVAGRRLDALLFETSSRDGLVFAVVVGTMLFTAVLACLVPARRAASVDPAIALRAD